MSHILLPRFLCVKHVKFSLVLLTQAVQRPTLGLGVAEIRRSTHGNRSRHAGAASFDPR